MFWDPALGDAAVRSLDFDEQKHKVLLDELKYLYTAVTRPRVNLWLFDKNVAKRDPMFRYFRRRRLCEVVSDVSDAADSGTAHPSGSGSKSGKGSSNWWVWLLVILLALSLGGGLGFAFATWRARHVAAKNKAYAKVTEAQY